MTILLQEDKDIREAHNVYKKFTRDEQMLELYEAREKFRRDYNSILAAKIEEAEQKGRMEGKMEGGKETRVEDVAGMYKAGVSVDIIAKGMELSVEEVRKILKERGLLAD